VLATDATTTNFDYDGVDLIGERKSSRNRSERIAAPFSVAIRLTCWLRMEVLGEFQPLGDLCGNDSFGTDCSQSHPESPRARRQRHG
jgi:hypothetical protein